MKRLLIVVLGAILVTGCGSSNRDAEEADEPTKVDLRNREDAKPVGENKKGKWSGWRWKGKRGNCYYVHRNRCFKRRKSACKAAGCSVSRCELDDSAPAKVSCKNKKKK